ncbi:aldo/keto reductase [Kribbella sp. NPDC026611]|uniref:aldo/keto reductase n=1 Tax=Kribbella sp. NPDC026611 TaxID=3154911 RepID=UPI0033DC248D
MTEFWQLGDVAVRRVGFGTKRLAGADGSNSREQAARLLRRAVELGVNHLDTAAFYPSVSPEGDSRQFEGLDWANAVVRDALAPYPDQFVVATKVGPTRHGLARPDELPALVERDLGQETLDLVYLRQTGLTSIAEHFGVLAGLQEKGMIRHLGLSNVRIPHLEEARQIAPVVAVQNRYGVGFGRVNDAVVSWCGERGIAFVPFFALAADAREAGGVSQSDTIQDIAQRYDATPAQVRLAWTLSRGDHVLAIPGTSSERHLEENLQAADLDLSPADLDLLDSFID